MINKAAERLAPSVASVGETEVKHLSHLASGLRDIATGSQACNEGDALLTMETRIVPVPILALLALINGVEEVGTRMAHFHISHGSEVGKRQLLVGGLR